MNKGFSIVIPVFNESNSIINLLDEIKSNLKEEKIMYEVIVVDDHSNDNSVSKINEYIIKYIVSFNLKLIVNKHNVGQSFSIREGIKSAIYDIIVTIDGDGQNNPRDIMKLINFYNSDKQITLVGGLRKKRKDNFLKIMSSKIANYIRKNILDDDCIDTGCSLKVFDKNIFLNFPYFSGLHRFLPALFKGYGHKTKFIEVDHRRRLESLSKYGTIDRLFRGIRDIFIVKKIIRKYNNKIY